MASVYACITTRDGRPSFDVLRAVNAACKRVSAARMGHTTCGHNVAVARNMGVVAALAGRFDYLLFVDNDTIIPVDTISALLNLRANVATGVTPTTNRATGQVHLNIASSGSDTWRREWFDGPVVTRLCGASCLMIKTSVFPAIQFPWFEFHEQYDGKDYKMRSEDLVFCDKVHRAGLGPIVVHGNVRCSHRREVDVADLLGSNGGDIEILSENPVFEMASD